MHQHHLTATSLTLLGQYPRVLRPIFMFLWVGQGVCQYMETFSVELPVIIAARQEITSAMINP